MKYIKTIILIFIFFLVIDKVNAEEIFLKPETNKKTISEIILLNDRGEKFSLVEFLEDNVEKGAVVNFWATWCSPCIIELPSLDKMAKKIKKYRLKVLTISMDRGETEELVKFLEEKGGNELIFAQDKKWNSGKVLSIKSIPETLIIKKNKNGKFTIVSRYRGALSWADDHVIDQVLKLIVN